MKKIINIACLISLMFFQEVNGEIYKYISVDGIFHFTDRPKYLAPHKSAIFDKGVKLKKEKYLFEKLVDTINSSNIIEQATYSVCTLKAGKRTGSAFFISENGHIITNRHIIRGDTAFYKSITIDYEKYKKSYESNIEFLEKQINNIDDEILINKKIYGENETTIFNLTQKKENIVKEIKKYKKRLEAMKSIIENRINFAKDVKSCENKFKIILKNGKVFNVVLLNESYTKDLALLKLDGYITPYLKPEDNYLIGDEVYTIGTPGGIKDFVSKGNIIDIAQGFVKSNAKVYPGSSGGPLVSAFGNFVGVNTCGGIDDDKRLGYAIPVKAVLDNFKIEFLK